MSIGVTKRQVQVMGTEPEVHAIVAKLDASLQRHEAWRQSQQLAGDEVVLQCVFKSSDLAQCDDAIERLTSRFPVGVTTTAGSRDRSVLAISGCKHEVIQATVYVASKVASSRPAPSNARSRRRSREREPPTERFRARPVPRPFQREPALALHMSAETDAPRMVKREELRAAKRHAFATSRARSSTRPCDIATTCAPVVVKRERPSASSPSVGQLPESLQQQHATAPLSQPRPLPSPRHESESLRDRPQASAGALASPGPPPPLPVPSVVVKPESTSEPPPPVGGSPGALQQPAATPPLQPQRLPSPRPLAFADPPARPASPLPSVVVKPEPTVGSSPATAQPRATAPRTVPSACAATLTNRERLVATIVVKPEPLQPLLPPQRPTPRQHVARPCAQAASSNPVATAAPVVPQPVADVYIKPEPCTAPTRAAPNPQDSRPIEPRDAHAAMPPSPLRRVAVQAEPVQQPVADVYIKPEPRLERTRATSRTVASSSAPASGFSEAPEAKRKASVLENNDSKRARQEPPRAPSVTLCAQATRVTSRIARSIALRLMQTGLQQVVAASKATVRLEPDTMDANYYTLSITGAWADTIAAQQALLALAPDV
ncbi:hypothetical protein SPRG_11435 [Saprolegnia parasitica CBS 223.65]|uniref:Uncharacterized protein n=1 Tax=Saprolegnia parasitica (strain CBS 223.65) TaxID=695850 RepID=A0A067BYZ7_SAPPC|nr:hypothetical protein SPRG_11435 [Saprolegnia parasitica CBS 223.65]KDO23513.1 hypothetical protein SPRG_11435 [Saprolegnia parasitica CBS 223.65]|eukprot:XP_012205826.1 hypothetical protein SPRG_11435 [Saprolegnia parasitica CBS 223.65]